jgi:hypothetical protein
VAPRRSVEEAAPLAVLAPLWPLDDDEVLSDEDEPLQKQLRQHSGVGSAVLDEAAAMTAVADKEVVNKRAAEEDAAKRATEERAMEEAAVKAAAAKEATGKTADEAARAVGGSPAPGQVPSVAGAKRAAAPSGSTPPAKCHYRSVWKPRFVPLSLFFCGASFSYYPFYPGPLPPARPPRRSRLP